MQIEKKIIKKSPIIVGAPKNEFGTRLCQRVTCKECNKVDYISKKLNANQEKYCRDCAEKILYKFESGKLLPADNIKHKCHQCQRDFFVNKELSKKKDSLMCFDCLRGFEVWQGRLGSKQKSNYNLEKKSDHLIIRKRVK